MRQLRRAARAACVSDFHIHQRLVRARSRSNPSVSTTEPAMPPLTVQADTRTVAR